MYSYMPMHEYSNKKSFFERATAAVSILALVISASWFTLGTRIGEVSAAPNSTPEIGFPITDGTVNSITTASDGSVFVGGDFTSIGPNTGNGGKVSKSTALSVGSQLNINGGVNAVIPDGSGGWYIGGIFTFIGSTARNRIAHILSDGSLDATFNPDANGSVRTLEYDGTYLYAGGEFTTIGGQSRNRLAQLNSTTGAATTWDPNVNGPVYSLEYDNASEIYVVGNFTDIGGNTRNHIASVDTTTGIVDGSFDPNAGGDVFEVVISGTTLYAGGAFLTIGGQSRSRIAALDVGTGLATTWDPGANGDVAELDISGTTLYAGGVFTTIGGAARARVAAIDTTIDTSNATAWNPAPNGTEVNEVKVDGANIYVGGDFTTIGGQSRSQVAIVDASGLATSWNANIIGSAPATHAIGFDATNLFIGGLFDSIGGVARRDLAKVNQDGTISSWDPVGTGAGMVVYDLLLDGSYLYVASSGGTYQSGIRDGLAKIDTSTGVLQTMDIDVGGSSAQALAISGTTLYVGGYFTTLDGSARSRIGAVNLLTDTVTSWDPGADGPVFDLETDGTNVYVAGSFTTLGGSARNNIGAVAIATALATAFNPNADGAVNDMVLSGSTVYAGGVFSNIGGSARSAIAALSSTTGTATAWNPGASSANVHKLIISGTTLYVGGFFTTIGGATRNKVASLDTTINTSNATTWNPNMSSGAVTVIALAIRNGVVYVGGDFTTVGGNNRPRLAQFGAAAPTLTTVSPGFENTGAAGFTLSATGLEFVNGSVLKWAGADRGTTFINETSISATIPSSDLLAAGTIAITVSSPSPGGGLSSPVNFYVVNPAERTFISTTYGTAGTFFSNNIAVGNLNADTYPDVVTDMSSVVHGVSVSLNNGDGTFPVAGTGYASVNINPNSIRLADFEGDGDLDIFVSYDSDTDVDYWLNDGSGVFTGPTSVVTTTDVTDIAVVDVDGDTDIDIISSHGSINSVGVTLQTGVNSGSFAATTTYTTGVGTDPTSLVVYRSGGVGTPDQVVTANTGDETLSRFTNAGGVLTSVGNVAATGVNDILAVDFTGDGDRDIVAAGNNLLSKYESAGGTVISPPNQTFPVLMAANSTKIKIATGSFSGLPHVLTTDGANKVTITNVSGSQTNYRVNPADASNAVQALATADFDQDGDMDFVTINSDNPDFSVMLQTTVSGISPASVIVGSAGFTLTVNGNNFDGDSVVYLDGVAKTTTFVNDTQITASILAGDITAVGNPFITVGNPDISVARTISSFDLSINPYPIPALTTISPTSKTEGESSFVLTVNGSDFYPASTVRINGNNRATTYVNSGQLTATILAGDIASAGTATITVFNPAPGGGTSGGATLTIDSAIPSNTGGGGTNVPVTPPSLTAITPNAVLVDSADVEVTLIGSGFNGSHLVRFRGIDLDTVFVNDRELRATIPAHQLREAGSFDVVVSSRQDASILSNAVSFIVGEEDRVSIDIGNLPAGSVVSDIVTDVVATENGVSFDAVAWADDKTGGIPIQGFTTSASGYTILVRQDRDLTSESGDNIAGFDANTGSLIPNSNPVPWVEPRGLGYFAYSTTSTNVRGGVPDRFFSGGVRRWAAFTSTDQPIATYSGVLGQPTSFTDHLLLRLGLGQGQPAGTYSNNIIITIIPNVP